MNDDPPSFPNVLASRYASAAMAAIWSPEAKIVHERRLWLAVLRAQASLGVDIDPGVIEAYEAVVDQVDLAAIAARESVTRHDVKARIDEFSALAGHEQIHRGMTSRDLTENVEQLQIRDSLVLIRDRLVAVLGRVGGLAVTHIDRVMVARTHNVAAQATTLGKRFADVAEELMIGIERVEELLARYPLQGIKGPVGSASTSSICSAIPPRSTSSNGWWPSISGSPGCSTASARSIPARWISTWSPRSCRPCRRRPARRRPYG
ncbi:MAG: lyase family protein [Acidimicrobiales bacterium]